MITGNRMKTRSTFQNLFARMKEIKDSMNFVPLYAKNRMIGMITCYARARQAIPL